MYKIAFTGHRRQKLADPQEAWNAIERFILQEREKHKDLVIISGGALGIDTYAAATARNSNIPFVMVLPFPIKVMSAKWILADTNHLKDLYKQAVKTVVIQREFSFEGYQKRNEYMVDHADLVAAYWNGSKGGTKNCVDYAKSEGKEIINLFDGEDNTPTTKEINFYTYRCENGFLSNFFMSPQIVGGIKYLSNEHYYQSMKAKQDKDAKVIRNTPTPFQAMRAGQALNKQQLKDDWHDIKPEVMLSGLKAKFENPNLRQKLLDTSSAALHEDSPTDLIWGKRGKDLLGKLLMQVRTDIKAATAKETATNA